MLVCSRPNTLKDKYIKSVFPDKEKFNLRNGFLEDNLILCLCELEIEEKEACKFLISPIDEKGKNLNSIDEYMILNILNEINLSNRYFSIKEVISILSAPYYRVPMWINVEYIEKNYEYHIINLEVSKRFRTEDILKNKETGHPPFKVKSSDSIQFDILESKNIKLGKVIFNKNESTFDYISNEFGDISILIGYMNIMFDSESREACQIWGFSPNITWRKKELLKPQSILGKLILKGFHEAGDNIRIVEAGEWNTYYDESKRLICIGEDKYSIDDNIIEFLQGVIVVITKGSISSIWIEIGEQYG